MSKLNIKKMNISEKNKKIINIVLTVLQIVLVLLAVTASIIIIVNPAQHVVGKTSTSLLPVLSPSMTGPHKDSFNEGDLVISKKPDGKKWDAYKLEIGDIITFENSEGRIITHRIHEVIGPGTPNVRYITKGDNNAHVDTDPAYVSASKVLGIYKSHLKGTGNAILWLQTPTNFLLVIVLPLVLLFIYNIVVFVKMLMDNKVAKATENVGAGITTEGLTEEEVKQKIIEEYLAKQKDVEVEKVAETEEVKVEETKADEVLEKKESDDEKKAEKKTASKKTAEKKVSEKKKSDNDKASDDKE